VEKVLQQLGDPAKLSAKYRDEQDCLIGPEFYSIYLLLLKIVLAAVVFGTALGTTLELMVSPPENVFAGIGQLLAAMFNGAAQGFAWVTVVFIINERVARRRLSVPEKKPWSISELPELPQKEALIKPADPIVDIVFSSIFLVIYILANRLFGVYTFGEGQALTIIPIFSQTGIAAFVPLFILHYCVSVMKEALKLIIGKWNLTLGIATAAINLALLVISAFILSNPGLWNPDFVAQMQAAGMEPSGISLEAIWNGITRGFLYVVAFGYIVESITAVIKGFRYGK
jgi:hypothetical protein